MSDLNEQLRAEFEVWARGVNCDMDFRDGYYESLLTMAAWEGFCGARRAPAPAASVQPRIKKWQERIEHGRYDTQSPAEQVIMRFTARDAEIADLRAALAAPAVQAEPVAVVDEGDDGMFATILPDRSVKIGQHLYAAPVAAPASADDARDAARYRWLREHTVAWNALKEPVWRTSGGLDCAIDSALALAKRSET